jgi:hypothetical protein
VFSCLTFRLRACCEKVCNGFLVLRSGDGRVYVCAEQLKRLAVQGLMQQLSPQMAYAPVPTVNVHNMISTDAHAAAATEQNNTQESSLVSKVKNTIKQARANLIPLLIGGAAALLFHNHLPVLKRAFSPPCCAPPGFATQCGVQLRGTKLCQCNR